MVLLQFIDPMIEGFQYFIALGSILGLVFLIIGILALLALPSRTRLKALLLIICSIILLAICGFDTGLRYFNIIM